MLLGLLEIVSKPFVHIVHQTFFPERKVIESVNKQSLNFSCVWPSCTNKQTGKKDTLLQAIILLQSCCRTVFLLGFGNNFNVTVYITWCVCVYISDFVSQDIFTCVHTLDTKTVSPVIFTIGYHSKHVMQKPLCWFP